jgi:hypothetical protein
MSAFGQYAAGSAGAPPAELSPAISAALQKDGAKVTSGGKPYCEIWFRTGKITGKTEDNQTIKGIDVGTLVGAIRWDGKGQDRRGQGIKPGVYTLRYGLIPVNGDHQGAAPQRDFVVMIPAANDTDLNAKPGFDQLMDMTRKASGTPHPAVLSLWKADADGPIAIAQQGESDWVLQDKLGDTPISIILVGVAAN